MDGFDGGTSAVGEIEAKSHGGAELDDDVPPLARNDTRLAEGIAARSDSRHKVHDPGRMHLPPARCRGSNVLEALRVPPRKGLRASAVEVELSAGRGGEDHRQTPAASGRADDNAAWPAAFHRERRMERP